MKTIFWFRRDLRLDDNPALQDALAQGKPVIPVFILDDEDAGADRPGGASRWWLHHSLHALGLALEAKGSRLILRRGSAHQVLTQLVQETGARQVFASKRIEPWARQQQARVERALADSDVTLVLGPYSLLHDPAGLQTGSGGPYRVFTPFWKTLQKRLTDLAPAAKVGTITAPSDWPQTNLLADWQLCPQQPNWAEGFSARWTPGEAGAQARLQVFLQSKLSAYAQERDYPARMVGSGLAAHLHFGEISPFTVYRHCQPFLQGDNAENAGKFLSELAWREFSAHLLFHFPQLPQRPLKPEFEAFPWESDARLLRAWQMGQTGYPIVDAGMRELWQTGSMHNRVRMIVASFLVKDLLLPWQEGQAWFWDTLLDADLANNSAGWQWVSGCGADAAPYFRVFNPVRQGQQFDAKGIYVRRWCPELARLPDADIHAPWEAPPMILAQAGIVLGRDYPFPLVDHAAARNRALQIFHGLAKA